MTILRFVCIIPMLLIFLLHMKYSLSIWLIEFYFSPLLVWKHTFYLLSFRYYLYIFNMPTCYSKWSPLIRISALLLSRTTNNPYPKSHVTGYQQFCSALNIFSHFFDSLFLFRFRHVTYICFLIIVRCISLLEHVEDDIPLSSGF